MENATQLHSNGIEPTDNRMMILSLFEKADKPLSASSLLLAMKGAHIHRATVFRTISLFEKNNIIKRIDFNEGEYRYELTTSDHHHHAVCRTCGAVERINGCTVTAIKNRQKRRTGFSTIDHSFTLFGICKKCSKLV